MMPILELSALLQNEISAVERFVALLQAEQSLLQSGDADPLLTLNEEKSTLIERLSALANDRNRQLAGAGLEADGAGLARWAAAHGGPAVELHDRLLALAREAKALNELNGQLIALRLSHTQAALAALAGDSSRGTLYGRDGQTSGRTGYRIIDSA